MPTAETTLIPASGINQRAAKKSLTSKARLDNEPILAGLRIKGGREPVGPILNIGEDGKAVIGAALNHFGN
jgi:hypothetical protein